MRVNLLPEGWGSLPAIAMFILILLPQQLESLCWERSGDTLVSSHSDGSYAVWSADSSSPVMQPTVATMPYGEWEWGGEGTPTFQAWSRLMNHGLGSWGCLALVGSSRRTCGWQQQHIKSENMRLRRVEKPQLG